MQSQGYVNAYIPITYIHTDIGAKVGKIVLVRDRDFRGFYAKKCTLVSRIVVYVCLFFFGKFCPPVCTFLDCMFINFFKCPHCMSIFTVSQYKIYFIQGDFVPLYALFWTVCLLIICNVPHCMSIPYCTTIRDTRVYSF